MNLLYENTVSNEIKKELMRKVASINNCYYECVTYKKNIDKETSKKN
jgi:hypothetical protein